AGPSGAAGARPGQDIALVAPADRPDEDVLSFGRHFPGDLGQQDIPDRRRPEVLDQYRRHDARMLVVVGGSRHGCAGDGIEHGAMDRAMWVGVMLIGGQGGHGVARAATPDIDAEQGGKCVVLRTWRGHAVDAGSRPGMGTAVAGQRLRLTLLNRLSKVSAPGSSSEGRVSITPPASMALNNSSPRSVRMSVSVQSPKAPMPPVEISACSAAKSGQLVQPSRVQACASLSGIS